MKRLNNTLLVAILALVAMTACNCNGNNGDDDDTDPVVIDCTNTTYQFGNELAEKCFCPNEGLIMNEVKESDDPDHPIPADHPLVGSWEKINSNCVPECGIAVIYEPTFPPEAFGNDGESTVDATDPTNKYVGGAGFEIISAADPSKKVEMSCDSERWVPWAITLMKWESSETGFGADPTGSQEIKFDSEKGIWGTLYRSANHSEYGGMNKEFEEESFNVQAVTGTNGELDVDQNGVLFEFALEDKDQAGEVPGWTEIEASDEFSSFDITSVSLTQFRIRVPENALTELTVKFKDTNPTNPTDDSPTNHTIEAQVDVDLTDPCDSVDCNGNGECVESEGVGVCDCDEGWDSATNCSTCADGYHDDNGDCVLDEECLPGNTSCNDNGTCSDDTGVIECSCFTGYDGDTCDICDTAANYTEWPLGSGICIEDQCNGVTCNGNGTCDDPSTGTCDCNNDWLDAGDDCGSCFPQYQNYPACDTCLDGYTNFPACNICASGYTDNPLNPGECIVDTCDPDPCNGHATSCTVDGPGVDNFTCSCATGFDGDTCGECAVGYDNYPLCAAIPTITNLAIDCSGDGGWCGAGHNYPVSWDFTDATTFDTTRTLISGSVSLGTLSEESGTLSGSPYSIDYTLGTGVVPAVVRLTVTVYGPGGQATTYIDVEHW